VTSVLRAQGVEVVGVPVDEDGLVVDALPPQARLLHVTPSHHYPLGSVLSLDRRLALVDWARRHQAVVIEDDYDGDLRYVRRPVEPLHHLDSEGRIASGSTSTSATQSRPPRG
jgi:GntR family transcriptional regulator/MocR family aminotransferase